jgi:hypothetical protein
MSAALHTSGEVIRASVDMSMSSLSAGPVTDVSAQPNQVHNHQIMSEEPRQVCEGGAQPHTQLDTLFHLHQIQQSQVAGQQGQPIFGTQSYPPRVAERRQMDVSPPVPLFTNTSGISNHKQAEANGYFDQQPPTPAHDASNQATWQNHGGGIPNGSSLPGQFETGDGAGKWYR